MKYAIEKIGIANLESGQVMNFNLNPTRCYELESLDLFASAPDNQHQYIRQMESFLNHCPEGFTLQWVFQNQVAAGKADIVNGNNHVYQTLADDIKNDRKNRRFFQKKHYLFVSSNHPKSPDPFYACPVLFRSIKKTCKSHDELHHDRFSQFESHTLPALESVGVKAISLTDNDIFRWCFSILNPHADHLCPSSMYEQRADVPESILNQHTYLKEITIRDQILRSPIINESRYIQINDTYITTLNMDILPTHIDGGLLKTLIHWSLCPIDVMVSIQCPNQQKELSKLTQKRRLLIGSAGLLSDSMSDREKSGAINDIESALDTMAEHEEQLFVLSITIIIKHTSQRELMKQTDALIDTLHSLHHMTMIRDDYNHIDMMMSILPGHAWMNKRHHTVFTKAASFFVPLSQTFKGSTPAQFFIDTPTQEQRPFSFKNNDLPASHALIIAPTGKGKSFTMNWLIKRLFMANNTDMVTIIDKGGSYRKLCTLFGGDYITIEFDKRCAINPFPDVLLMVINNECVPDQVIYLRKLICILIADDTTSTFSSYEEHLIEICIQELYQSAYKNNKKTVLLGNFVDYIKQKKIDADDQPFITRILKNLSIFTKAESPYSLLLNQPSAISLNNRFTVFDRTALKDHPRLASIYFFLINSVVQQRMLRGLAQGCTQYVINEEVADLLIDEASAALLAESYRTARKYGTIHFAVSQMVSDFTQNHLTKAIVSNSYIKFILHLDSEYDQLHHLGLHDNDHHTIEHLKRVPKVYSDVFVKFGQTSVVMRVQPTALEYELCATDSQSYERYHTLYDASGEALLNRMLEETYHV